MSYEGTFIIKIMSIIWYINIQVLSSWHPRSCGHSSTKQSCTQYIYCTQL